jgi:hypothetical protein
MWRYKGLFVYHFCVVAQINKLVLTVSVDLWQVHLEQGPVLEALRYPLGVVKGIAGQTRLKVHCSLLLYFC